MIMSLIQQAVFSLIKTALWGHSFTADSDTDWDAIYNELCVHTVESLPVDALCLADKDSQSKYIQRTAENVMTWFSVMHEQQELCSLLQNAGISFVILKGAASCIYYPQPTYRVMGDIDILVKPKCLENARSIMLENGYILNGSVNHRHLEFSRNGVHIEIHRYFSTFNDREKMELLDSMLYTAIEQAQSVTIEGFCFPVLPRTENGLVLLTHIGKHLEAGLGLRQIIDWMLFVDKELDDELWNTEFHSLAQQLGLDTLAVTVTKMCQLYLGLRTDITWCSYGDESLCQELIRLIFELGNFGRKNAPSKQKVFSTLNRFFGASGIIGLFKHLQNRGCHNWAALKKHSWLNPFAWLYQICRYIRLTFKHKQFMQILKSIGRSREQSELLERLGVVRCGRDVATPDEN